MVLMYCEHYNSNQYTSTFPPGGLCATQAYYPVPISILTSKEIGMEIGTGYEVSATLSLFLSLSQHIQYSMVRTYI